MIEQAKAQARGAHQVEPGEGPLRLEQAHQLERPVQGADVPVGGDDDRAPAADRQRADDEALRPPPATHRTNPKDRNASSADGRTRLGQAGTCGTRASAGSAQRELGISGVQPGRSGSWSYGYVPSRRKSS